MLFAISAGRNTQSEIVKDLGISQPMCSRYLDLLTRLGFIGRHSSMLRMKENRTYHITEPILAFSYKVIQPRSSLLGSLDTNPRHEVMRTINTYMGRAFEDVVERYIVESYSPHRVGKWVGTVDGENTDIDVVAQIYTDDDVEVTLLCECKFKRESADFSELNKLEARAEVAGCRSNRRLMIASVSGFTDRLVEYAEANGVMLVGTDKLFGRVAPDPIWPKLSDGLW